MSKKYLYFLFYINNIFNNSFDNLDNRFSVI